MWWKIFFAIAVIAVGVFVGIVARMAITEAKEEVRDIDEAGKQKKG